MKDRPPYPTSSLEAVLAEMVLCALAWEEQQEQGDRFIQGRGLTGTTPSIHCPSLGETSRQGWPKNEE
jgi:hypothetical protein